MKCSPPRRLRPAILPHVGLAFWIVPLLWAAPARCQSQELSFRVRPLTIDANEGMATGDIDGDGMPDLVAGRSWYRDGHWAPRPLRLIDDWNGYVQSNGDYLYDVNADGRLDVIAGSFLPGEVHWFENPGDEPLRLGQLWKQHLLLDTGDSENEGQLFQDIDGDGRPEWIVNSWNPRRPMVVWRLVDTQPDAPGGAAIRGVKHTLGPVNGHGVAVGDLSGDGRADVLIGHGWYEQPAGDPWSTAWKFRPAWELHSSLPMIVADIDEDGDQDLIYGNGHDYGLQWWEQIGRDDDGEIRWQEHAIDSSYSQPHCLAWVDLDGDGQPELITGKRYFAHNGGDPGGRDMPCLYYYRWDAATRTFTRHVIEEGHVGTGLQIVARDLNGDGKIDLAVAGKSGTYLLEAQ